jgi:hypothetical protein
MQNSSLTPQVKFFFWKKKCSNFLPKKQENSSLTLQIKFFWKKNTQFLRNLEKHELKIVAEEMLFLFFDKKYAKYRYNCIDYKRGTAKRNRSVARLCNNKC